jgi:hypothetical protein
MKQKPKFLFTWWRRSSKERRRRARRRPHPRVARATPLSRRPMVWTPRPLSDIALPPINLLHWENPKGPNIYPWKVL